MRESLLAVSLLALIATSLAGCDAEPRATARTVMARAQLIGGNRALGDVGDVLMENDRIRIVIQAPGYSRGFGVYGGSLIDADLRRPREGEASGRDAFGELFPGFFLQAVAVDTVTIESDGADGGPARVVASGRGGDFLELLGVLNRAVVGSHVDVFDYESEQNIRYETIYTLQPHAQNVEITFRVTNTSEADLPLPGTAAVDLLDLLGLTAEGLSVPIADVALFGDTSKAFLPGAGFDLRHGLEAAYENDVEWPAFPGLVAEWIASRGEDVSYGLIATDNGNNYAFNNREVYETADTPVTPTSLLIPFVASSFLGIFYDRAPTVLAAGESFEVKKHFIVGRGDVGSVLDEIHRIRGADVGRLSGQVYDELSGQPAPGESVLVYQRRGDGTRRIFAQYDVRARGAFGGTLEPGDYSLRVEGEGRPLSELVDFAVQSGATTDLRVAAPSSGRLVVHLRDPSGAELPGKVTVVGTYGAEHVGQEPREFLFDLPSGQHFRSADLVPDDPDVASTRRYIESFAYTRNGKAVLHLPPGYYTVYSSRGPEYDLVSSRVTIRAGRTVAEDHLLTRVVDTRGYVAADMHLHSINSIDAATTVQERVLSVAGEGIEWAVSTDHNYVTDYAPAIARNGLAPWLRSSVGLELTSLESGHFNGYPLRYESGPITHGSFEWSSRPPQEIFQAFRDMGRYGPADTIVQVNHPRDSILGYFDQYQRSALTAEEQGGGVIDTFIRPTGPAFVTEDGQSTFSLEFDALEILNGKLTWEVHHYRVPEGAPAGLPPVGTVLTDEEGIVESPGVVDDWYNLLNLGHRFIGVGTSDSHDDEDEPGYYRTMVYVGEDHPGAVSELDFVRGLQSRRVVATNGPMVDFFINDETSGAMGQTLADGDGTVSVTIRLTAAPWISVGRLNLVRNGAIAEVITVDPERDLSADPFSTTIDVPLATDGAGNPIDSWFLVEAIGYRSYFPVVRPLEVPPLLLTDAVASVAAPLGLGGTASGIEPPQIFQYSAHAVTNPIWITTADRAFEAPGVLPTDQQISPDNASGYAPPAPPSPRVMGVRREVGLSATDRLHRQPQSRYDIRRMLNAFNHGR